MARAVGAGLRPGACGHPAGGVRGARPQGPLRQGPGRQDPGITGIDDPYEVPTDADLVIDTTDKTIDEAVGVVVEHLIVEGWLDRP